MTPEQVRFYENLYGKKMKTVLRALDLKKDDLRDPNDVLKMGPFYSTYLLPETVTYNGVDFYALLIFTSEREPHMRSNVFCEIWFIAEDFEPQEAIDFSKGLFEDAMELYEDETTSEFHYSLLNAACMKRFLAGEEGFTDKWYINDDKTFVQVTGGGCEKDRYATIKYEIHLSPP